MNAEQFLQNQYYNYLNKFTKYDLIRFTELYHESEKKQILTNFVKWINSQPIEFFKNLSSGDLVDLFLNPKP